MPEIADNIDETATVVVSPRKKSAGKALLVMLGVVAGLALLIALNMW